MLQQKTRGVTVVLLIGLAAIFTSVFFAKPWFGAASYLANNANPNPSRDAIYIKKADLFNNLRQFDPVTHEAKTVFRLTVPLIMKVFNLSYVDMYYLQIVLGMLILIMLAFIAYDVTHDYLTTLLIALACSCTFFCRSYFMDTYMTFDTYAYFFFTVGIISRKKPWILMPAIIALFFTDERGAMAVGIIWLCIKLMDRNDPQNITLRELFSIKDNSLYLFIALAICIAIRLFLHWKYNMSTPANNLTIGFFFNTWKGFQMGIWSGIAGFWGFLLMVVTLCAYNKKYLLGVLLLGAIIIFTFTSALVADRTKSIAYLVPLAFICVRYLYYNSTGTNKLLFMVMVINMIYPGSINPTPDAGVYFFPYTMDILFKLANGAHGVLH